MASVFSKVNPFIRAKKILHHPLIQTEIGLLKIYYPRILNATKKKMP